LPDELSEKSPDHLVCYVDDEVNLLGVVKRGLERRGWKVEAIGDPFDALRKIRRVMPRVIVLCSCRAWTGSRSCAP
jgi:ActR/RegA family two-component response regulator